MAMQIDTFMPYGRFKEINGNHAQSKTDYAERVKEKQAALRAEKAKEAAEEKGSGKLSEPQDIYISSEKSGKEPAGLYRIGQDENGSRKIFFDDPDKADRADGKEEPKAEKADGKKPKVDGDSQGKPAEVCIGNTDKVDREIEKLKKKQQEQQIRSASGDERKIRELEKKLAQVEQELSQKDNDTYRKQHSEFSRLA